MTKEKLHTDDSHDTQTTNNHNTAQAHDDAKHAGNYTLVLSANTTENSVPELQEDICKNVYN